MPKTISQLSEVRYRSIEDFCKHLRALKFVVRRTKTRIYIGIPEGHGLHYEDTAFLMKHYSLCFSVGAGGHVYLSSIVFVKNPPFYWKSPMEMKRK